MFVLDRFFSIFAAPDDTGGGSVSAPAGGEGGGGGGGGGASSTAAASPSGGGLSGWLNRQSTEAGTAPAAAAETTTTTEQTATDAATATTAATTTAATTGTTQTPAPGSPEARVAELEAQLAGYKGFDPVIEQLKAKGFTDAQAIQVKLAEQQQQNALTTRLTKLQTDLQKRVDADELTPEQAEAEYDRQEALIQREIQADRILGDLQSTKVQNDLTAAVTQFPALKESGADTFVHALHAAGMGEVAPLAELFNAVLTGHGERAVAAYVKQQGETGSTAQTVPAGGGAAPPAQAADAAPQPRGWAKILGIPTH